MHCFFKKPIEKSDVTQSKYIKKKKLQEVYHLQMGGDTELGGNQCSAPGKESLGKSGGASSRGGH